MNDKPYMEKIANHANANLKSVANVFSWLTLTNVWYI